MQGLVGYGSDGGDEEKPNVQSNIITPQAGKAHNSTKRVVNITLPLNTLKAADGDEEERPTKKFHTSSTPLFAMLPAPKNVSGAKAKDTPPKTNQKQPQASSSVSAPAQHPVAQIRKQAIFNKKKMPLLPAAKSTTPEEDNHDFFSFAFPMSTSASDTTSQHMGNEVVHPPSTHYPLSSHSGSIEYPQQESYEHKEHKGTSQSIPSIPNNIPRDFAQAFAGGNVIEIDQRAIIGHNKKRFTPTPIKLSTLGASPSAPKPSQVQRQRHQLTSLLFDAQQKELELMERGAVSRKTKTVTRGKYGW